LTKLLQFDPDLLSDHFDDHGLDFNATDEFQYEAMARDFLGKPLPGTPVDCKACRHCNCKAWHTIHECRKGDDRIRYDTATNEFAMENIGRYIRTYFKPNTSVHRFRTNSQYFHDECEIK
jgi:pyocin large subunit-like protein